MTLFQIGIRFWEVIAIAKPKFSAKIFYDNEPKNPRLNEVNNRIICWHDKYHLGDRHSYHSEKELLEELMKKSNIHPEETSVDMDNFESEKGKILKELKKHIPIIPLYLYDGKFPEMTCAAERGRQQGEFVGYIFMDEEMLDKLIQTSGEKRLNDAVWDMLEDVDLYSNYISGNNFLLELYKDGEHFCEVSGFTGQLNDDLLHDMEMAAGDALTGERVSAEEVSDMFGIDAPQIIEDKERTSVPAIESVEYGEYEEEL